MRNCTIVLALFTALVLLMFAGTAQADTYNWTRTGASFDFQWDEGNGDHWNPDTGTGYPNAIGDVANMRNSYENLNAGKQQVLIDRDITVGTILLGLTWDCCNRPGQDFTISAGDRLVMDDLDDVAEILRNNTPKRANTFPVTFKGAGTIELNDDLVIANECPDTNGERLQFDAVITENGGPFDVTKKGPGRVIFNGNNTYTGDTKVTAGTLTLNNLSALAGSSLDVSGAGTVNFNASGTYQLGGLKGAGSVNAEANTLKVASLSPGNSVGTLTVESTLDISPIVDDGSLLFELGDDTIGGTTYDQVSMVGEALEIGTLTFDDFTFAPLAGFGAGNYTLFDAGGITGSLGTADGTIDGLVSTLSISGNDVLLTVTASQPGAVIPEPSTLLIWALGLLGLALVGRRRKR